MKLGIIGSGSIVETFLPYFHHKENLELTALLCTQRSLPHAEELGRQYRIGLVTSDPDEFFDQDFDTVYIGVPNHLHSAYALACAEHGKNAIVEKPFCACIEESETVFAEAEKNHVLIFEAIMTPYNRMFDVVREKLPLIGKIRLVQAQQTQYSRRYDAFERGEILPAFDPEKAGGSLMDLNHYCMHFVMDLFGRPEEAVYFANMQKGIDTSGTVILKYPDLQGICAAGKDCRGSAFTLIQGTKGWIRSSMSPGIIGDVTVELNDGTKETYAMDLQSFRSAPDHLEKIIALIDANDTDAYLLAKEQTLAVSSVQTEIRRRAGIRFPCD